MNWLNVDQIGNSNKAGTWQEHHAEATISQTGDWNDSRIYQSGTAGGALNTASTIIEGNSNTTDIYQFGEGQNASIDIYNNSNNNEVDIDQFDGNNNRASYRIGHGQYNDLQLTQDGNGNRSHVQVLSGADENIVNILQEGTDNRGLWVISGGTSDGNILSVTSQGNGNRATGEITGGGLNEVTVTQFGDDNWVGTGAGWNAKDGVDIHGSSNVVNISQLTDGNMSVQTVTGSNNTINVTQN